MPTNRRRRLQSRRTDVHSERTELRLLGGHDWEWMDGQPLSDDELRAAWDDLREELLARHIAEHPGSRPWAWWQYDTPEPRRQIGPGPEPIGDADWFGCPSKFRGIPPSGMYESEADYLERLGLLKDDERRRLREPRARTLGDDQCRPQA
jgi:hypothetical protein